MKNLPRLLNCLEAIPLKELGVNGGSSPAFWEVLVVLITFLSFGSDGIFVISVDTQVLCMGMDTHNFCEFPY